MIEWKRDKDEEKRIRIEKIKQEKKDETMKRLEKQKRGKPASEFKGGIRKGKFRRPTPNKDDDSPEANGIKKPFLNLGDHLDLLVDNQYVDDDEDDDRFDDDDDDEEYMRTVLLLIEQQEKAEGQQGVSDDANGSGENEEYRHVEEDENDENDYPYDYRADYDDRYNDEDDYDDRYFDEEDY